MSKMALINKPGGLAMTSLIKIVRCLFSASTKSKIQSKQIEKVVQKPKPIQPELAEYQRQVSELRKKYAQEMAHIPTAAQLEAQNKLAKRQKADAEWSAYLQRMRAALQDPDLPEGFDSMHKALRAKPVLARRRERIKAIKEADGYREAAAEGVHQVEMSKVETRRKYLQLLKEEAASWVNEGNLGERIAKAIDNPVEFGSHLAEVMEREAAIARRLEELKTAGPILPSDTQIINLH